MSDTAAILLVVGLVTVGSALVFWLQSRGKKKARSASEAFQKRLKNPDIDGLEKQLGCPVPASLRAMYQDSNFICASDLVIEIPNPIEKEPECYIAWFLPADIEALTIKWPGCEGLFPFADNGAGDLFLIDLRQADPQVIYYLHETGESGEIGVTLSAFLVAPRRPVSDQ